MDKKQTQTTNVVEDLGTLFELYSQLEELAVQSLKVNIDQLENKVSKKDAEALLTEIASNHIDLDRQIFALKKKLGLVEPYKKAPEKGAE